MSGSRAYFLKTDRLGFSTWSESDLPLAMALWGDPKVTALIGGPFTAAAIQERLLTEIASMNAYSVQYWPIFALPDDQHVGCAGIRSYRPSDLIYELGFHLRPAHWGRGFAEEAGRAVISYAFQTIGAKALFAGHHPDNSASRRVLAKLGFAFTHEELYPATGLKHPSYLREICRGSASVTEPRISKRF